MTLNIWSGAGSLASALTNPTELAFKKGKLDTHYPVEFRGKLYSDAETAYQCLKIGETEADDDLMARIIMMKFQQHKDLATRVTALGGIDFLKTCRHFTGARSARFRSWEGFGESSRFIRNLIAGYKLSLE